MCYTMAAGSPHPETALPASPAANPDSRRPAANPPPCPVLRIPPVPLLARPAAPPHRALFGPHPAGESLAASHSSAQALTLRSPISVADRSRCGIAAAGLFTYWG
ncbi:hypothetical protein PVAP13_2NG301115 [Panicum virgatum]|uniref:Uncharacterized protein n=1 Tax=Panicum virgatum TaxID=38727 RepID=A0A8T0VFG9_PANVG|nr:hypothetical protein PVAP13_2NG301115 [Panicum virgatum]